MNIKDLIKRQIQGFRKAEEQGWIESNPATELQKMSYLFEMAAKQPCRADSGLVEMQKIFRRGIS